MIRSNRMPRSTPMTIPAICPPLRPLLDVVDAAPAVDVPEDAVGTAVWKGTVVVAEPVDVIVSVVPLVGRIYADPAAEVKDAK